MKKIKEQQVTFTLRLPKPIQEAAKAKADAEHVSLNSLVIRLLERAVKQKGQQQ